MNGETATVRPIRTERTLNVTLNTRPTVSFSQDGRSRCVGDAWSRLFGATGAGTGEVSAGRFCTGCAAGFGFGGAGAGAVVVGVDEAGDGLAGD